MIIDRTKHPQYSYEGIEIPSSCIKEKRDDQNIDSSYSGCFCDILIWGRIRPERKYYVTKIIWLIREIRDADEMIEINAYLGMLRNHLRRKEILGF